MAKTKKNVRKSQSNANTGEIVLAAIKKLTRNTGWTARTIVKFIKMEYALTDNNISRKVSRALKRGVKLGLLQMDRGRYRLNNLSRLARPIDKEETARHRQAKRTRPKERPLRFRSLSPKLKPERRTN